MSSKENRMKDRITIEGRHGVFSAYIARPKDLAAPAVVVLHEVFGVNADIRKTCTELADQGFVAVAPDLFWHQEPGVVRGSISEIGLMEFMRLDQGAVLAKAGVDSDPKSARLIIGIPLTTPSTSTPHL